MTNSFLGDDFLLTNDTGKALFAKCLDLPIIDYHCHLSPEQIADDGNFSNIVEVWLGGRTPQGGYYGDHYKWRLMRANGVPEDLITGDAPDEAKFEAFAATMEKAVGNPVHLWTHLELRRIFGITDELTTATAKSIFARTNEMLASPEFSRRNLIRRSNVEVVCTTDDPIDDLHWHKALTSEKSFSVVPAFRPDAALNIERPSFAEWINRLEQVVGAGITGFADLVGALAARVDFFHDADGWLSDHGIDSFTFADATPAQLDAILAAARAEQPLTPIEATQYRTAMLIELARIYADHGWTMQLHFHAARNLNSALFKTMGLDVGIDAMTDEPLAASLAQFLDAVTKTGALPRMIIYSLNPDDWMPIASVMGCYQGGVQQALTLGNAWWFNDTRSGIRQQLTTMAEQSLLGNFVGMTTDSRSFLSYPRHEYFRRILCDLVGEWAERGEITDDPERLGELVRNISYFNAKQFFASESQSGGASLSNLTVQSEPDAVVARLVKASD